MDYLAHHGTKGMKWGVRRYQNPDGSLTAEGRKRYERNADNARRASEYYKDHAARLDNLRKPATAFSGAAASAYAAAALAPFGLTPAAIGVIAACGAISASLTNGSYRVSSATDRWLAKRQDMKVSEIEKIMNS